MPGAEVKGGVSVSVVVVGCFGCCSFISTALGWLPIFQRALSCVWAACIRPNNPACVDLVVKPARHCCAPVSFLSLFVLNRCGLDKAGCLDAWYSLSFALDRMYELKEELQNSKRIASPNQHGDVLT